jgi:hypothetical protein
VCAVSRQHVDTTAAYEMSGRAPLLFVSCWALSLTIVTTLQPDHRWNMFCSGANQPSGTAIRSSALLCYRIPRSAATSASGAVSHLLALSRPRRLVACWNHKEWSGTVCSSPSPPHLW